MTDRANPYGFKGDVYKAYRKLVKEFGRVAVHKVIDTEPGNPGKGLVLATWTLHTA